MMGRESHNGDRNRRRGREKSKGDGRGCPLWAPHLAELTSASQHSGFPQVIKIKKRKCYFFSKDK